MKKVFFLLLYLILYNTAYSQSKTPLSKEQIEKEIQVYIKENIKTYELFPKEKLKIKASMMDVCVPSEKEFDEKKIRRKY
uniref:hypothetical protein n=1 Tax=Flavobacterium sp. TaxID=239 RepID=UPI00404B3164